MVTVWSDWHVGEKVDPTDVLYREPFNLEVARARVGKLVASVTSLTNEFSRPVCKVDKLLILALGDFFTGEFIYNGQRSFIDLILLEQYLEVANLLADAVNTLTASFKHVEMHCVVGNHGRMGRYGDAHPRSNLEALLYEHVKEKLKRNGRAMVKVYETEIGEVEWMGRKIGFGHGGQLMKGRAAHVETAMARAATSWPHLLRTNLDIIAFGHFHRSQYARIGEVPVFVNGSLVGGNYFSTSVLRTYSPPTQWMFGVHPKRVTFFREIDFIKDPKQVIV